MSYYFKPQRVQLISSLAKVAVKNVVKSIHSLVKPGHTTGVSIWSNLVTKCVPIGKTVHSTGSNLVKLVTTCVPIWVYLVTKYVVTRYTYVFQFGQTWPSLDQLPELKILVSKIHLILVSTATVIVVTGIITQLFAFFIPWL